MVLNGFYDTIIDGIEIYNKSLQLYDVFLNKNISDQGNINKTYNQYNYNDFLNLVLDTSNAIKCDLNLINKKNNFIDTAFDFNQSLNNAIVALSNHIINKPNLLNDICLDYVKHMQELNSQIVLKNYNNNSLNSFNNFDKRLNAKEWSDNLFFEYLKNTYIIKSNLLFNLIEKIQGIDEDEKHEMLFVVKRMLEILSPANFIATNPQIINETIQNNGINIINGINKAIEDLKSYEFLSLPAFSNLDYFKVGKNLAYTKGKVVYEDELLQLIFFKPQNTEVKSIPILIVPPWINKYYIFDLQEENSFIKWLCNNSHEVFAISWKNADKTIQDKGLEDYVNNTINAIKNVLNFSKSKKVNLIGYCVGGILSSIVNAYLTNIKDNSINTLSLFATPFDFEKIGDLKIFTNGERLKKINKVIDEKGYLPGDLMLKVFSFIRANDMIWNNFIDQYFLDKKPRPIDFLHWNCDTTNISKKLNNDYLKTFFTNNAFKNNTLKINNIKLSLKDLINPIFCIATKNDHIVPFECAFFLKEMLPNNTTFVLGDSGHVAGIINSSIKNKYQYWLNDNSFDTHNDWFNNANCFSGSWWSYFDQWLLKHDDDLKKTKYNYIKKIEDAPGRYVLEKA